MVSEQLVPSTGWGALHLFFKVPAQPDSEAISSALKTAQADGYQIVTAAMLGHKCDLAVMALGPDLWRLRRLQGELVQAGLQLATSYVSLTEVSEYAAGMPEERKIPRLYPVLPPAGKRAFCFYPMSRRRDVGQNWFELPYEDRKNLMITHGSTGKGFSGRVIQVVTGSTGIDDWEWGVTLFANNPDDLKDVVYTMRYDEVSAKFADFGPFYAGMVGEIGQVLSGLGFTWG